ncbi:MAG: regulatory protein RecX [Clostridia bacterium]|nr:regulatory protein RecX [Clostridia bacterium]
MTVSVLSVSARGSDEIAVTFEISEGELRQRARFLLSSRAFADLRLTVGECDRSVFDAASEAAELYSAVKRGLFILGYGSCSKKDLCRRLVMKGIPREVANAAVNELAADGFINERADAEREAERCVSKLWGRKKITAHLYNKGYSEEAVKGALYALEDSGVDFSELCAERLRRAYDSLPDDPKDIQRVMAALARCGFSGSEIKTAMRIFKDE